MQTSAVQIRKQLLAVLFSLAMVFALSPVLSLTSYAESAAVNGGDTISGNGTYELAEGATGTITVASGANATIIGNSYDNDSQSFTGKFVDLNIVVEDGANLTIQDMYVDVDQDAKPIIDFQGTSTLTVKGHNLLDRPDGYGSCATIHVGEGADVTFDGDGYLWGYKHAAGSYIGSNANEVCGNITFKGGTYLLKASKTGALIGQDSTSPATGKVVIDGGTIYLKAVARGSLLGASAQGMAPDVIVNGGQLEFVTDWQGAAIGSRTAANAGNLTVNGGSIRTIVTQNAYGKWGIDAGTNVGAVLSDNNITAAHDTKMLAFDATKYADADKISVYVDGGDTPFYEGGLYEFCTNEVKNPTKPYANATMCNWLPNTSEYSLAGVEYLAGAYPSQDADSSVIGSQLAGDNTLVFQLPKTNHTLTVNGDSYFCVYDEAAAAFVLYEKVEAVDPTCTEAGNIEYWKNSDGGMITVDESGTVTAVSADDVTLPLADHAFGEDGFCTVCGKLDPQISELTINDAETLAAIAGLVNGGDTMHGVVIKLGSDIDLKDYENWTPIGNSANAFAGTFSGEGHTISNLSITSSNGYAGLFGNNGGIVKDFTLTGQYGSAEAAISAKGDCHAAAVAYNTGSVEEIITDVDMYLTGGDGYATGGVVGRNDGGLVRHCGNEGDISCDITKSFYRTGGITGHLQNNGSVTGCYNHGRIEAWNYRNGCQGTGGIVGSIDTNGEVMNCYNTGEIYNGKGDSETGGKQGCGGIVGAVNTGNVSYCYATGNTHGPASSGIILGKIGNGTYDHLYMLDAARAYNQYGTKTDNGINYCDGSDENADGTIKVGGAAIGRDYNSGYTITNSYVKTDAEMKSYEFAVEIGDGFVPQCGYPVLEWETPKAHTQENGKASYTWTQADPADAYSPYISVTAKYLCGGCGVKVMAEETVDLTEADYEVTQKPSSTEEGTGTFTAKFENPLFTEQTMDIPIEKLTAAEVEARDEALEAITDKIINANSVLASGQYTEESYQALKDAIDTANALYNDDTATESDVKAAQAAITAALRTLEPVDQAAKADEAELNDAIDALAETLINVYNNVNMSQYKAATVKELQAAIGAAEAALADEGSTAAEVKQAKTDLLMKWKGLEKKDAQPLKVTASSASTNYKAMTGAAKTFSLVKASGNKGKITYSLAGGSTSGLTIDKTTGRITLKKGANAGAYTAKVRVTAAATADCFGAAKTVAAKITVARVNQTLTVKTAVKTAKVKAVKKKAVTVTGAVKAAKATGKVTYKKVSGSAKLKVNAANGSVTVKKGTSKGTYKIKVKVSAAGNINYKPASKTVNVKIKIK